MGYFNSQIITKSGAELLAKASAGKKIVFDKMYTGSGQYTVKEIAELLNATDLKEPQQSFAISSCDQEHEQIRLRATISNNGLQKGYDITEIGLYAKEDGKESVLVAISIYTDNKPTHLPQFEDTPVEIYVSNVLAFSGDGNFSIEYRSDVYVTTQEFREEIDKCALQDNLDMHVNDQESHVTPEERKGWNKAKKHAESTHARADATKAEKSTTNGNIKINGTETTVYTHPSGTNPHGTTKNDVGLGNVDNTADANKSVKYATSAGSADAVAWSNVSGKPAIPESGDYSSDNTEALLKKVMGLTPRMGSARFTKDTHVGNTWWNFFYIPHRTGVGEDNGDYGTLLLFPMAVDSTSYIVRAGRGGVVTSLSSIITSSNISSQSVNSATTVNGHTVKSDVPENAVFTDTVYDDTEVQKRISDNGYGEVAGGKNLLNHNIIDSKIKNCSVLFKNDTFYVTNKGSYSYFVLSVPTIVGKSYTVTIKDWSDYSYRCIASVSDLSDNTLVSMVITDATLSMTFTAVGTESLIHISPNNTANEMSNTITFKCMLEEGSVETDYEPYFPSNKMLAEEKADKSETTVNLLNPTLQTTISNGVTCTSNGDGTYTFNGTATAEATFIVQIIGNIVEKYANKDLWLVGCPKNGSMNTYRQHFWGEGQEMMFDTGSGTKFRIENTTKNANIAIIIEAGVTVDNIVFKPMITTNLDATYDDFVPYTGSTGQINSDVADIQSALDGKAASSHTHTKSQITDLPEYEEGIWTPTFSVGGAGLSGSTGNCVYKKIGNVVHVQAYAKISGGGSMVSVGGFPYRIETSGDSSYGSLQSTPIQCYIGNATTPNQLVSFNGSSSVFIPSVNVSNNTPLIINGYYFTDE